MDWIFVALAWFLGLASVQLITIVIILNHILKSLRKIERRLESVTVPVDGVSVIATYDLK